MFFENPRGYIVFDCDGTLVSSKEAVISAVAEVMSIILQRDVSIEEARKKYGPDMVYTANQFGLDPVGSEIQRNKLMSTWKEVTSKQSNDYKLFAGMKKLILDLLNQEFQLYVWTARDRRSTLRILDDQDVLQHFLELRCLDDTTPKPHPQGLIEMLEDAPKDKIMLIGDSFSDTQGAKSFGVKSIGALWESGITKDGFGEHTADYWATHPSECLEIILNNINK
ncbi:HAD hydrolase, family IA, variant 1 [Halobacteriovorax sp. BALOs_7]|uniref:phosphoglycolate phosphatase n=1 Tax=Halobacteriovorax vibrionivorans TaxID=2152716 RepID=A0ABY0IDM1_9BACT|nr:HAD hydrolase, family IA, variant 1 [Halobacteriovorax sp. BALOs_7]RZF21056.1 hypothetical protein DAY19_13840 [Halobacteriovorax vibrionivorans]TGD47058.1 hypothetical protein EP118_09815 [Halobacteriovorax sp. Y22]